MATPTATHVVTSEQLAVDTRRASDTSLEDVATHLAVKIADAFIAHEVPLAVWIDDYEAIRAEQKRRTADLNAWIAEQESQP